MEEDVRVLRATRFARPLREVVAATGMPERRCRTVLQRLRKRGYVAVSGRLWRITRDGAKYLGEIERSTPSGQSAQESDRSKSLRDEYATHLEAKEFSRKKSELGARAGRVLQMLEKVVSDCKSIPFARPERDELGPLEEEIRWFTERLPQVTDAGKLEKAQAELEPLIQKGETLVLQAQARIKQLRGFEFLEEDDWTFEIKLKCKGCGALQTHSLSAEIGEAEEFKCTNPQCDVVGRVHGRPDEPPFFGW